MSSNFDEISSNIHEINKFQKNKIKNIDEIINTNSTAFNEICKEADEKHLAKFDFIKTQTAFDKIQQNYKKVSEVFKCQTELQEFYERNRNLGELIEVIQNQKVFKLYAIYSLKIRY